MERLKLLVIGAGMASMRFLEELVALVPAQFDITVVGEEREAGYNRVLLSPLLAGEIQTLDLSGKPAAWYAASGIRLVTGAKVVAMDVKARNAVLSDGATLPFDRAVIATGSTPVRLNVPGANLAGVEVFRSLEDTERLNAAANARAPVAVIGGGLLGIEAAYGLMRAGAEVTLLHVMDRLMERQLDAHAAALLKAAIEAKGIRVCLGADTERIEGAERVTGLKLKDGRQIDAALIVMAVGVRPRIDVAQEAGLSCKRGIVVDDRMRTSCKSIFAIGECAEHRGAVYGLVEPAYEHAKTAASALAGQQAEYGGTVLATNLKVSGVPVFSAGDFEAAGAEAIVARDQRAGTYRKFVIRDGRLVGCVLIGDTADALWYRDLIRSADEIASFRSMLPFGRAFAEAA